MAVTDTNETTETTDEKPRNVGKMDKEDIYSIIVYMRSIPSIEHVVEPSAPDFPMNFIINTIPQQGIPQTRPDKKDILAYGAYMVNASGCVECHTQVNDQGQILKEVSFAGGREFLLPDGSVVRASNLTSDKETGIGFWTEEIFIRKFKAYVDSSYVPEPVKQGEFNSIMPWTMYGKMQREDLAAIFAHLQTIQPISNKVEKFTASKGQ